MIEPVRPYCQCAKPSGRVESEAERELRIRASLALLFPKASAEEVDAMARSYLIPSSFAKPNIFICASCGKTYTPKALPRVPFKAKVLDEWRVREEGG